MIKKDLIFNV